MTRGLYTAQPSADIDSPAYARLQKRLGSEAPDPYCGAGDRLYQPRGADHRQAGEATGMAMHDNVRKITQAPGGRSTARSRV